MINSKTNYKKIIIVLTTIVVIFSIYYIYTSNKSNDKIVQITESPSSEKIDISKYDLPTNISPLANTTNTKPDEIYGINRKNGNLIRYKDNREIVIYSGKVKDYSINDNTAIIINEGNLSEIVVINLDNNIQTKINLSSISPITAVTLSGDSKTIYFLAGFDIERKISTIYSIPISGANYQKLNETTAQSLTYLKEDTLLLFQNDHAENKSILYFFNLKQNKITFSKFANTYKISPDGNYLAIKTSKNIELVNTESFQSRSVQTQESNRFLWKDNSTIVIFRNANNSVNYATLKVNSLKLTAFKVLVPESSIVTAFGFIENRLIWQDYKDEILSVVIEGI